MVTVARVAPKSTILSRLNEYATKFADFCNREKTVFIIASAENYM
jgi:hypothetical protein